MSTPISTNAIGGGILKQLHVDAWSVVNDHLSWTIAGKTHRFATDDADGLRVDLDVTDPAGAIASSVRVVVSGSFDGMLVLEPDAAARLHLERFEIPGTAVIDRGSHRIECRRARVRVRLPDVGVDALVPVAIWPR
ncbi:MAG: hypothetical protein HYR85_10455 [Planctomycetes bacterium]|nr:hypothetical protein [Planctomycetota bacterium]